jgi:large subunit ribosomal protein L25
MDRVTLRADERGESGSRVARRMRRAGQVPAVLYGRDQASTSVAVDERDLYGALRTEAGLNVLIDLKVGDDSILTVARGLQRHPVRGDIIHLDFVKISLTETIEAEVAINPIGIPVGVREDGGILESVRTQITVEALPTAIPSAIDIDISGLHIGESLSLEDVDTLEGVEFVDEPDTTLFTVQAPRIEVETEVEVELDEEGMPIVLEGEEAVEGEEGAEEGEGAEAEAGSDDSGAEG